MKKSDARNKTEKNEKNMFFSRKKHEMKKTVFFTTLVQNIIIIAIGGMMADPPILQSISHSSLKP